MNLKKSLFLIMVMFLLVSFAGNEKYNLLFRLSNSPYELEIKCTEHSDTIIKIVGKVKYIIYNRNMQSNILLEVYDSTGRMVEKSEYLKSPDILKKYIKSIDPVSLETTYSIIEYKEAIPSGMCIFYDSLGNVRTMYKATVKFDGKSSSCE